MNLLQLVIIQGNCRKKMRHLIQGNICTVALIGDMNFRIIIQDLTG